MNTTRVKEELVPVSCQPGDTRDKTSCPLPAALLAETGRERGRARSQPGRSAPALAARCEDGVCTTVAMPTASQMGAETPFGLRRHPGPTRAPVRALPAASAPASTLVGEQERGSRYRPPSPFHSSCGAFLLSGLTGARSLPACLPDFHSNVFSRTGYVSNQLLHHSMFQHKYMQCSAATILQGALLCNTDCRKAVVPYLPRCPPRLPRCARAYRADSTPKHASRASLHEITE